MARNQVAAPRKPRSVSPTNTRKPRAYQCYDCGRTVEETDLSRRNITTYGSSGRYLRTNTRRVNLCPDCEQIREQRDARNGRITLIVAVVIVIAVVAWFAAETLRRGRLPF
jgi:hypothetical protein